MEVHNTSYKEKLLNQVDFSCVTLYVLKYPIDSEIIFTLSY